MSNWQHLPSNNFTINYDSDGDDIPQIILNTVIKDYINDVENSAGNFSYYIKLQEQSINVNGVLVDVLNVTGPIASATGNGYLVTENNRSVQHTINFQNLAQIPNGSSNQITLTFNVFRVNTTNNTSSLLEFSGVTINLNILENVVIDVSPTNLSFGHVIDQTLPPDQNVSVTIPSEAINQEFTIEVDKMFTVSGSSLIFDGLATHPQFGEINVYTGTGSQTLKVVLNSTVNTLSPGTILDTLRVVKETTTRVVGLTTILTSDSFVDISPSAFNFEAFIGFLEAEKQQIRVQSSGVIVVNAPFWLNIDTTSANLSLISDVKPVPSTSLSPGTYQNNIEVVANGVTYLIPATYIIYEKVQLGLSLQNLNFTDDYKSISTFTEDDTFRLLLELQVNYYNYNNPNLRQKVLNYTLGFFNRKLQFFIGKTLNNILPELLDLNTINFENLIESNTFTTYYLPAQINLQCVFQNINNPTDTDEISFTNIKFVTGRKPMRTLPSTVLLDFYNAPLRVTQKSVTLFNFHKEENHNLRIYKNGVFINSVAHVVGSNRLFGYKHSFNSYTPGDVIEIRLYQPQPQQLPIGWFEDSVNYLSQTYIVFPEGKESHIIAWEDEYRCIQLMEFTGSITYKMAYESKIIKDYRSFKETMRKIDGTRQQNVTINTGPILKENTKQLDGLLDSKRAWLLFKDEPAIALVPNTGDFINADSDQDVYEYEVEFKINLNNDCKINS